MGPGRAFSTHKVCGYYLDYSEKVRAAGVTGPERLSSIAVIQVALGWWEGSLGAPGAEADSFLQACEIALERGETRGGSLLWPLTAPVAKFGLRSPWCSALVQGQAASVFVRAHQLTGEERWAAAARDSIAPLLEPSGDLVTATARGPILEEAPSVPGSHILNGWISALLGVRDVAVALDHDTARGVFDESIGALCAYLPAYDTGWWTRYSLYPHPIEDLAKPIYHRVHAEQVAILYELTGIPRFRDAAARWRAYDRPAATVAAVAQKALFVAVDGRRRRRQPRFGDGP